MTIAGSKVGEVPFQPYKQFITAISRNAAFSDEGAGIYTAAQVSAILAEQYSLGYVVDKFIYLWHSESAIQVMYLLKHKDA